MADDTGKSALERIAEVLQAHKVDFIVVGGQAGFCSEVLVSPTTSISATGGVLKT